MPYKIVYKRGRNKGIRFVANTFKTMRSASAYAKKYVKYDVGKKIKVVRYKKR